MNFVFQSCNAVNVFRSNSIKEKKKFSTKQLYKKVFREVHEDNTKMNSFKLISTRKKDITRENSKSHYLQDLQNI